MKKFIKLVRGSDRVCFDGRVLQYIKSGTTRFKKNDIGELLEGSSVGYYVYFEKYNCSTFYFSNNLKKDSINYITASNIWKQLK